MIELLKLCGFKEQEIKSELPRIEKAFGKLGLDHEDINRGKHRLLKYYDMRLEGIRKIFCLCIKELVNAILVRDEGEKKVIYGFMFPGMELISSALASKSGKVFSIYHSWAYHIVAGCIFGKIIPMMEEAENRWLKAGMVSHCANVKTLVGPIVTGLFPRPELLATAGFMCETAPKTLDLLNELYDIPVWYVDTCQDRDSREYPDPADRIATLLAKSMRSFTRRVQEIVDFEITDNELLEVQNAKSKLEGAVGRVKNLVQNSDPLVLSPAHDNILGCLNQLTLNIDEIEGATRIVNGLYEDLQERVSKGTGVVEKGSPRMLALLPAGQTDPSLEQLTTELGIASVSRDARLPVTNDNTISDPYLKFSLGAQQKSALIPQKKVSLIIETCKELKVNGVLDKFHAGCRTVAGDALIIEAAIRKELDIPVLVLEWENFDPRAYKHEQFKNKLEVFRAMMKRSSSADNV